MFALPSGARTSRKSRPRTRLLVSGAVVVAAVLATAASPERSLASQRCYVPANRICVNNVAGDFAAKTDPWISGSVFSGSSIQSFFNNLTSGTPKRQIMYLRNGPNNFSFWFQQDTAQVGRLWYVNTTSTSYILSRCQTLGGGTVTVQCGEVLSGDAWIAYPN